MCGQRKRGIPKHNGRLRAGNINEHFVTRYAGDQIARNERSYMLDSEGNAWSCKVAGLSARFYPDESGSSAVHGHFETLHYKNRQLAHAPMIHGQQQGCLLSVKK